MIEIILRLEQMRTDWISKLRLTQKWYLGNLGGLSRLFIVKTKHFFSHVHV